MSKMLINMEDILHDAISGYHQYILSAPLRLNYVSKNLCDMLGVSESELIDEHVDRYAEMLHPADRTKYAALLKKLKEKEQSLSEEYRLIKKDGTVLYVRDTIVSKRDETGTILGFSVLSDISHIKKEKDNLQFLNETIPCGFLKYSCEKQPKVTYINQKMIDMLRIPNARDGELDYLEMYKSNVFLMIPMEERRRFSLYLNRVYSAEAPIAGEMALLRCDGSRAHVFGWVTKNINEEGIEEFQSVCMDVTERHHSIKSEETKRYLKALTDVYDSIFEFNLDTNTLRCLHSDDTSKFKSFENLAVQIDDALEKWLVDAVEEAERPTMRAFFRDYCQKRLEDTEEKPAQIIYKARSSDGNIRQYAGIFIKVDASISFYCCRRLHDHAETENLRSENAQMKENVKDLLMNFSDGIAAFEVSAQGMVKPLYASENVCEFFGYSKEEWIPLTERYTPLEEFVAYSEAAYEDFAELLRRGEAQFSYFDYVSEKERKIKAICSQRENDNSSSRYVMLYSVDENSEEEKPGLQEKRDVVIRTFGYFDVFVGDRPIAFRNKKAKELFALLVDRRGGYIDSEEAIGFLWEEEPVNSVTLSRYRKVALRLKNTLEEYGISSIVESVDGKRRIIMDQVQCDLYQYLSGKEEYNQLFKGTYLSNYSWAEMTLGELISNLN